MTTPQAQALAQALNDYRSSGPGDDWYGDIADDHPLDHDRLDADQGRNPNWLPTADGGEVRWWGGEWVAQ